MIRFLVAFCVVWTAWQALILPVLLAAEVYRRAARGEGVGPQPLEVMPPDDTSDKSASQRMPLPSVPVDPPSPAPYCAACWDAPLPCPKCRDRLSASTADHHAVERLIDETRGRPCA